VATTMTNRRYSPFAERVRIEELDRLARIAEDTQRVAALIAEDLGYERVRINQVAPGDRLVFWERDVRGDRVVSKLDQRIEDPPGEAHFVVDLADAIHGNVRLTFEDGEFVSRLLFPTDEAF